MHLLSLHDDVIIHNLCKKLIIEFKVCFRKPLRFHKICSNSFFHSFLNYILILRSKHMLSTDFEKICCSFALNKIFEKSRMNAKMADLL